MPRYKMYVSFTACSFSLSVGGRAILTTQPRPERETEHALKEKWPILYVTTRLRYASSRLGGVVVSVLATGPKGCGFKPGRGDGFLRAIKISSTSSFG
jgi:hypothetical protein